MTRRPRPKLRYAPATVGQPPDCPTGLDRFPNRDRAMAALVYGYGPHNLTPHPCESGCGGWHNLPADETPPAGDCEPAWQPAPTLATRREADDVPTGDLL